MAKLTDLPNELLLYIMADLCPLYIDSFVLICKHFYELGIDTVRAQNLVRSRLPTCLFGTEPAELLRSILQDPGMAIYPLSCNFFTPSSLNVDSPQDLYAKIQLQIAQSPHPGFPTVIGSRQTAAEMVIPLLISRLLNLRKLRIFGHRQPYLLDTVSGIVEASHDEGRDMEESLALGRLTEVSIKAFDRNDYALHLAVLLSMIPTVKVLKASGLVHGQGYNFPYKSHGSAITHLILDGCVDSSFLKELIKNTRDLQSFEFMYLTEFLARDVVLRRFLEILLQHAGDSLLHLSLLTGDCENCLQGLCVRSPRNYVDLSLGSLRGFRNLKTLVTTVEMFKRARDFDFRWLGIGTRQKLVSSLPASLEALVLHKGCDKWKYHVLSELFRGFRDKRQTYLPKLKLIDFVTFPDFDKVMPRDIKAACRELGIKIGYTMHNRQNLHVRQILRQIEMFEELPWIAVLGKCYQYKGHPHCEWVSA